MLEIPLNWPMESANQEMGKGASFSHKGSNIVLDFHGNPLIAQLVVFSDGNHHMALEETLQTFLKVNPGVKDVFYVTTPPPILLSILESGKINVGNLELDLDCHFFIGPPNVCKQLVEKGKLKATMPFMRSRGNVLLVRKGNPKSIQGIEDLYREDVRIFISNPDEKSSHQLYRKTLTNLANNSELDGSKIDSLLSRPGERVVHGEVIHHREAPQALAADRADTCPLYYHLALRYTRIFPDLFDIVPLGGTVDDPKPDPGNLSSYYETGLIGDGGKWGNRLHEYLMSEEVTNIYNRHGLLRPPSEG